jgi:5-methylcytosine-specific restriction endonuclease McrA
MPRTKITELGKLTFLTDGGLVCLVTVNQLPLPDRSVREASLYWAAANQGEPAIGDLVVHGEHGVARFWGHKSIEQGDGEKDFLLLEFAQGKRVYVPLNRRYLVQKLGMDCALTNVDSKGSTWPILYCVEVLPSAHEWPSIGKLPDVPRESGWYSNWGLTRKERSANGEARVEAYGQAMVEWHRACAAYQRALHADASYQQAAKEYFDRQKREPQSLFDWWVYRTIVLRVGTASAGNRDEQLLLIKQYVLRRERNVEKMRREVETLENFGSVAGVGREPIPEDVRLFVWRRDKGQCVRCGSRERLEFDHIIPVAASGSNTERNIQLLCELCNRSKGASV